MEGWERVRWGSGKELRASGPEHKTEGMVIF